jgi:chorismate mutase
VMRKLSWQFWWGARRRWGRRDTAANSQDASAKFDGSGSGHRQVPAASRALIDTLREGSEINSAENREGEVQNVMMNIADPGMNFRELRDSIDNIDAAIVHMLAERFRCTRAIGMMKAQLRLPARDPKREVVQIGRLRALATASRLNPDFAEKFLAFVSSEVIRNHETMLRSVPD